MSLGDDVSNDTPLYRQDCIQELENLHEFRHSDKIREYVIGSPIRMFAPMDAGLVAGVAIAFSYQVRKGIGLGGRDQNAG